MWWSLINRAARKQYDSLSYQGGIGQAEDSINGKEVIVDLPEVYSDKNLADNIISYGILEECGVILKRDGNRNYVVREADNMNIFEVIRRNNALTIDFMGEESKEARARVVNSAVPQGYDG